MTKYTLHSSRPMISVHTRIDEGNYELTLEADNVSDEYHSMAELYEHRMTLNMALFNLIDGWEGDGMKVLKAKRHSDGTMFDGYFIVMLIISSMRGDKQISYHYKLKHWDKFRIPEYVVCPYPYDGHTSKDVLARLSEL